LPFHGPHSIPPIKFILGNYFRNSLNSFSPTTDSPTTMPRCLIILPLEGYGIVRMGDSRESKKLGVTDAVPVSSTSSSGDHLTILSVRLDRKLPRYPITHVMVPRKTTKSM